MASSTWLGRWAALLHALPRVDSQASATIELPVPGPRATSVREATFTYYFSRIGLPIESALVVSFMGAGLIILFSLSGAVAYLLRGPGRGSAFGPEGPPDSEDGA